MQLFFLLQLALCERILHGSHHDLPASAEENVALLKMKQTPIKDTSKTINDAILQNYDVHEQLYRIIMMPYFSTYKVDLSDKKCPLENDQATCSNQQCVIEPLSSKDIDPKLFDQQYLGRLRKNSVQLSPPDIDPEECAPDNRSLLRCDKNYCYPEDDSQESEGVYVDLNGNQERFTGYDGAHARLMWTKVYEENCFGYFGENAEDDINVMTRQKQPLFEQNDKKREVDLPAGCVEQRLFYRLLSGMQSSISTHLTYDWYNSTSEKWQTNLPDWLERVGWHPDRLNNMFFDYTLMSRAVDKLINSFGSQLLFSTTCSTVENEVRSALLRLGLILRKSPLKGAVNETLLFKDPEFEHIKDEFRQRVRNVNQLMSCVGCERCRLWGKIQTAGYGTALKILLELPENPSDNLEATKEVLSTFRRSELVALINTFARISHSVYAVDEYYDQAENILIDKHSFRYSFDQEMALTWQGLKFIFQSYIDFPKNMFFITLNALDKWWSKFSGVEHTEL